MKGAEIKKEYRLVRVVSHPFFLLIIFLLILFSIGLVVLFGRKNYIIIASLLFVLLLLGYFWETRTKITLFSDKIIIKRCLSQDKIFLISDLASVKKRHRVYYSPYVCPFLTEHEFYLKNGERVTLPMVKDYYELIEDIKKINPSIKIEEI